jgi:chemotaxis protein MotB
MFNRETTARIDEETTPGVPEWFVTFADMMTLLLAFFVMLVSMSNFQEPKEFQSLVAMLQEQFGHQPSQGEVEKNLVVAANADDLPDAEQRKGTLPGGIIHFGNLSTELTEEHKRALHQIAQQLAASDTTLEIRGHSSQVVLDPNSGVRDLWDLADRRCHSTMAFLIEQGVDPARIRLANAGVSEPLYNGADPSRLSGNSRVEIRLIEDGLDGF